MVLACAAGNAREFPQCTFIHAVGVEATSVTALPLDCHILLLLFAYENEQPIFSYAKSSTVGPRAGDQPAL